MVELTEYLDVAQVVLYVFWAFFAVLLFYLQAESRREGYPVESDETGDYDKDPWLYMPSPKTFKLPHGHGEVSVPNDIRDTRPIKAERPNEWFGGALVPIGDPLYDAIGPGAYAERADRPDLNAEGEPVIRPMSIATNFTIEERDPDPRGMTVTTADGETAGTITDIWIDTAELQIRYFEVDTGDGHKVLLPLGFAAMRKKKGDFYVHALLSDQIKHVPQIASKEQITLLEEEKICAFYGGGQLYATRERSEPII
ncbi:MAG: photosynthetic reaction center subunit H [Pseudomonadota bacterium]